MSIVTIVFKYISEKNPKRMAPEQWRHNDSLIFTENIYDKELLLEPLNNHYQKWSLNINNIVKPSEW